MSLTIYFKDNEKFILKLRENICPETSSGGHPSFKVETFEVDTRGRLIYGSPDILNNDEYCVDVVDNPDKNSGKPQLMIALFCSSSFEVENDNKLFLKAISSDSIASLKNNYFIPFILFLHFTKLLLLL